MKTEEIQEVQVIDAGIEVFEAQERASIDIQVSTAKKYPRNLRRVKDTSVAIACMNKETAESCRYAKPVGGKNVTGPSVHLARIVCQQYGNIRVQQRIKQITDKTIIAEAVAFDMETNYAVCVEARRSILDKRGIRFSESNVETNAMAILAIAERNAILKVVPKSIIDTVYEEAFKFANGDLSDNGKLLVAKEKLFEIMQNKYGATEEEVLTCVGAGTKEAVTKEQVVDLKGYIQAIQDKEITLDELFKRNNSREAADKTITKQDESKKEETKKVQI